jgi:hypothetical protein
VRRPEARRNQSGINSLFIGYQVAALSNQWE